MGKINILKNHKTFAHLIKGTFLGRALWGLLIPSPRITDSQTQNLVFRRPCFIFFGFSLVFQNKLWWRLQTLFVFAKFYLFSSSHRDFGCDNGYGESPTFSIGDGDVHIPAIILVPTISQSSFKLLKCSQLIK